MVHATLVQQLGFAVSIVSPMGSVRGFCEKFCASFVAAAFESVL